MNDESRAKIEAHAKSLVTLAKTKPGAYKQIADTLIRVAHHAMTDEQESWENALNQKGIGPKTREKILKAVREAKNGTKSM